MKRGFYLAVVLSVSSLAPAAFADTVRMKNGDVYRGTIVQEEFNNFIQIELKDGSEKHLLWGDVASLERTPSEPVAEVSKTEDAPSPYRFELDLTGFSYDSYWQNLTLNDVLGRQLAQSNASIHNFITNPEDFTVRAYLARWHIFFEYFTDQSVVGASLNDQQFANTAFTFALNHRVELGLDVQLNRQSGTIAGATATGANYFFGPYLRLVLPFSDGSDFEFTGAVGPVFRNASLTTSSASADANGAGFGATTSLYVAIEIAKPVSALIGVDGFLGVSSLGAGSNGSSLTANTYRLRAVPLGLRIKF